MSILGRFKFGVTKTPVAIDLAVVLTAATRTARWRPAYKPYATVPASERDVAVVVSKLTPSADLLALMRKAGRPLLEHV